MSTSPTPKSSRTKKVVIPKVWKRPHSTIYGKNVEFGSSLYSDKIGELNGRKFNSELPWSVRNGGYSSPSAGPSYNQGYLSSLLVDHTSPGGFNSVRHTCDSYAGLLEMTNPSRSSKRKVPRDGCSMRPSFVASGSDKRIDFYDQYMDFSKHIDLVTNSSLLMNEPLLKRKVYDNFLDFDYELGIFVPNFDNSSTRYIRDHRNVRSSLNEMEINTKSFALPTTNFAPQQKFQIKSSPYGQSADGRKLSLGSINPHSYRPSLPQKTTTARASDGEEIEFHDKSSPFYTDRWAGKTIRHFDSDLYSNANLFKSMIL